ncbi:MAG: hypothetical protein ACFBSD_01320 [Paracoccaceae bacterium]
MTPATARVLLALALLGWGAAVVVNPPGPYTIDEVIYLFAIEAWAETGRMVVETGFERFPADGLRLLFLVEGRGGLVPQYPSGFAILAAPVFEVAGIRGVMALNFAAALAVLGLTVALGHRLAGPSVGWTAGALLAGGTFLLDYAIGVWPHALTLAGTTAAVLAVIVAVERQAAADDPVPGGWGLGLLAGLAVGAGLNLRVDAVLILPPLGLWVLLVAKRPWPVLIGLTVGLLPGVALATWLNWAKFGVALPISYGPDRGSSTNPLRYLTLGLGLAAGFAALLLWRTAGRPRAVAWAALGLAAAGGAAAVAIFPQAADLARRAVAGAYALGIDLRAYPARETDPFVAFKDGVPLFIGTMKQALLPSLPWLGLLALLFWPRAGGTAPSERRYLGLMALVTGLVALPFLPTAWHGGLSNTLRYFLPLVPLLAVAGALAIDRLTAGPGKLRPAALMLPALLLLGALIWALVTDPFQGLATLEYRAPLWLGLALAGVAAVHGGLLWRGAGRPAALTGGAVRAATVAGAALVVVSVGLYDLSVSMYRRDAGIPEPGAYAALPFPALVLGPDLADLRALVPRADAYVAMAPWKEPSVARAVLLEAEAAGLSIVALDPFMTDTLSAANPDFRVEPLPAPEGASVLFRP